MASPDLLASVIVPAFGRTEMLAEAVRSALAQDLDPRKFEVIVVDSSPDDRNMAMLAGLERETRCPLRFFAKPPEGPGPSRNLGARQARGRILAFLDSDCQASSHWLREGLAAFQDRVGLVQGRTIPDPHAAHSVFNRSLRVEQEGFIYEAANMFYRREAFEQAGGFRSDPDPKAVPLGGEDVELAWAVKRAGWESSFAAEALVVHAVFRISPWRWLFDKHMFVVPRIVRNFPETRRFFFGRYFFDNVQAWLVLGLLGLGLAPASPFALLLTLPYAFTRGGEPSRAMRGPRRLLRVLVYLPRDLLTLGLLLAGSLRYRALLL